jgi:hypothetical protein
MPARTASRRTQAVAAGIAVLLALPVRAEQLTPDQERRINLGVSLIKLGCGTGVSKDQTQITGTADASLTLKKMPGVSVGGQVTYNTEEAQGLVATLQKEVSDNATTLSVAQLTCMRPYVDRIFAMVFPDQAPSPQSAQAAPLAMTLPAGAVQPLDGYAFAPGVALPASFEPGRLLPGGGRVRIAFQAKNPDQVVQIDRVALAVTRQDLTPATALPYTVDPTAQSGFGAARPRVFNAVLKDTGKADVFYITDQQASIRVPAANILPRREAPILELDSHAGLQETLDVNLVPTHPGFYAVKFTAYAASQGQDYTLVSAPIYIVRR